LGKDWEEPETTQKKEGKKDRESAPKAIDIGRSILITMKEGLQPQEIEDTIKKTAEGGGHLQKAGAGQEIKEKSRSERRGVGQTAARRPQSGKGICLECKGLDFEKGNSKGQGDRRLYRGVDII